MTNQLVNINRLDNLSLLSINLALLSSMYPIFIKLNKDVEEYSKRYKLSKSQSKIHKYSSNGFILGISASIVINIIRETMEITS